MRSRKWRAFGLAALVLASGAVFARDKVNLNKRKRAAKAKRADRPKAPRDARARRSRYSSAWRYELDRIAKELALSEDQKKLVADAIEVQQEELKEQEKANAAKMKLLYEQSKKIREEMTALSKQRYRGRYAYRAKIAEVLTDDQKLKWAKMQLQELLARSYFGLKFTEEQSKKIDALVAESAAKITGLTPQQQEQALPKAVEELKKAIDALLPADQKKLARAEWAAEQALRMFRRAELTEEQVAKVKALALESMNESERLTARVKELSKELNQLRMRARPGSYSDLAKKVRESILTDEQRAKYPDRRERRPTRPERPSKRKPRD